jgi:ammonia channel protein AmtB
MQSGFGLLETGMVDTKNEVNIMMKNVVDVVCGGLSFWAAGYAIGFGKGETPSAISGFMGTHEFFVQNTDDGVLHSRYIFQFSFAATSTTIVSGSVAGRMKFVSYMAFRLYPQLTTAATYHHRHLPPPPFTWFSAS